jgi:hypothetical protein
MQRWAFEAGDPLQHGPKTKNPGARRTPGFQKDRVVPGYWMVMAAFGACDEPLPAIRF